MGPLADPVSSKPLSDLSGQTAIAGDVSSEPGPDQRSCEMRGAAYCIIVEPGVHVLRWKVADIAPVVDAAPDKSPRSAALQRAPASGGKALAVITRPANVCGRLG